MLRTLVPLALLLAAPVALAGPGSHPDVGRDVAPDACLTCHTGETPEVVKQWESSPHGLMLVKCFVCHGSAGKDFVEHPKPKRCEGCHAEQVASVAASAKRGKKAKDADCFSCHAAHTLATREGVANPHGAR